MNRFGILAAAVTLVVTGVVVTACGGAAPTATQPAVPSSQATATPLPAGQPTATVSIQPFPTSTAITQPATPAQPGQTALTLVVSEPKDESVVTTTLVEVTGQTAPDAIVSVNGTIVKAIDASGSFATSVPLVEGPNLIEVIASDYQNNQVSKTLTVISVP